MKILLLLLALLLPLQATAKMQQSACPIPLLDGMRLFEDGSAQMTIEAVSRLPAERFRSIDGQRFPVAFSHSAFWLQLSMRDAPAAGCRHWLQVGAPRLEQVELYRQIGGRWQRQQLGSDYPLERWALRQRQAAFPLVWQGEPEADRLWVRVASRSLLVIEPRLLDGPGLLRQLGEGNLLDGMMLGLMLMVVLLGTLIGLQLRSPLLLINAGVSLSYMLLTFIVSGYLFYLPALLPHARDIVSVLSCLAASLFLLYLALLYRVWLLPKAFLWGLAGYAALVAGVLLAGLAVDFPLTRELFSQLRWLFYLLVPVLCLANWLHGLRPGWLGWGLALLLLLQGLSLLLLNNPAMEWYFAEDALSPESASLAIALLFCTLLSEFRRIRRNERRLVQSLDELRKAEQMSLEQRVALRTQQLRESLNARNALVARISHDLRAPLQAIIEYSRRWREELNDYPQRIERNARLQLDLIDQLLEFSRRDLHQEELVLAPDYLHGFLKEVVHEARFFAQLRGNQLGCELDPELPALVQADFRMLRRVLVNLLGNASKFTRDGQISLRVESMASDPYGSTLRFTVEDNGSGLPVEVREQLLRPFKRNGTPRESDGFGLGLSIVSDLLLQMGTRLHYQARPGGGSQFSFNLALQHAEEGQVGRVFKESHADGADGHGKRIILVDDVELTLNFLGDLLMGYGYDVVLAASGEEALGLIAWGQLDLLITDQFMPGMDGWALLREVRRYRPGLPVLLYSASPAQEEQSHDGLRFDAQLLKPADSSELLACVQRLCGPGPLAD